jgi:AraC family transcriptional regulator of arabinose operon
LLLTGSRALWAIAPEPLPFERPLRIASAGFIRICLEQLRDELTRGDTAPDDMVVADSLRILARQLRRAAGMRVEATAGVLDRVHTYIEANISRPMMLDELAEKAELSVSRFSELFSRRFGCSPMRYVTELRLRRAAILLNDPGLSIAQVAEEVGFSDPLYFSRRFRLHFDASPTRYRRIVLGR